MSITTICLSGEGVSDFGSSGKEGPFCHLVKMLMAQKYQCTGVRYVIIERSALSSQHKAEPRRKAFRMHGAKEPDRKLQRLRVWAEALGKLARQYSPDFSILQEDVDMTNKDLSGDSRAHTKDKHDRVDKMRQAMKNGFALSESKGIPMITCPRSEAWLLCLMEGCSLSPERIEALPCNDQAPEGAKALLAKFGCECADDKTDLVISRFQPHKGIPLYSYSCFASDLDEMMANFS